MHLTLSSTAVAPLSFCCCSLRPLSLSLQMHSLSHRRRRRHYYFAICFPRCSSLRCVLSLLSLLLKFPYCLSQAQSEKEREREGRPRQRIQIPIPMASSSGDIIASIRCMQSACKCAVGERGAMKGSEGGETGNGAQTSQISQ